ncbi:MAG: RNA polymerase subunit sigma-24 [Actinobacteria bacterium 13_1_20CM_3_68_9]|nr:MAG: RNA polymerase subunit sigma-24 [Actinobacteria bacterium 13_1_20CM_3_68_9]
MAPAAAPARRPEAQPELEDTYLVALAKRGSADAYDRIVRRYRGFVRLKASSYFLLGGGADDLVQEGLLGLYKAIRDYRSDRESHAPLNQYVSFAQTPAGASDSETTLEEVLPGPGSEDPSERVIATEELQSLVSCLSSVLSELESHVLSLYLDGHSYEQVGEHLDCDTKTVDNALQRVKRKVSLHLASREVRM